MTFETYLSLGVTSIQSFPIRTTGQLFLHSCLDFYLHQGKAPKGEKISSLIITIMILFIHMIKCPYSVPASFGFTLVCGDDGNPGQLVLLLLLLLLFRWHSSFSATPRIFLGRLQGKWINNQNRRPKMGAEFNLTAIKLSWMNSSCNCKSPKD